MKNKVIKAVLATCVAFIACFTAFFTGCATVDDWAADIIKKYYYRFDGDYSCIENIDGLSASEMVSRLDRYCAYYTSEEYSRMLAENAGSKNGVGVSYRYTAGRGITVRNVIFGSPAQKAGLHAGDIVTAAEYDGGAVVFSSEEDFSGFVSALPDDSAFTFVMEDGRRVELAKRAYTASYVKMYFNGKEYGVSYGDGMSITQKDGISELPQGTACLRLSQFYGNAPAEMGEMFKIFNEQGGTSLILDLRDNGGGYVDVMLGISGLFTSPREEDAPAMLVKFKDGSAVCYNCKNYDAGYGGLIGGDVDVYVLANQNTASASEALIGVLIGYNILDYGNIFLSQYEGAVPKSYGKGIMQSTFRHVSGEALKITVAGIYWPDENNTTIHNRGLRAEDGCSLAPASDDIVDLGYDDEVAAAVDKILSKSA